MRIRYWLILGVMALAIAACSTAQPAPDAVGLAVVAGDYKGIPQGVTADGHFTLGNPAAKVSLIDYSDFL